MVKENISMQISVVGSEDGKQTYEVRRTWNPDGKKALVLELYPTISVKNPMVLDISTLHLLNHANELGWGEVRVVNLYPYVFHRKPGVHELHESVENIEYIRDILTGKNIDEYDIVIAYGSSLASHTCTQHIKRNILLMLKEYKLEAQVKHIVTDTIDTEKQCGTHPLFLGLRHSSDVWELETFPLSLALEECSPHKEVPEKPAVSSKKRVSKKGEKNVPATEKQA